MLEDDGHRAVVHELDLHSRAEEARLYGNSMCPKLLAEPLVHRFRHVGPGGTREARPVAPRSVREQRELADDERLAADVEERPVELPVVPLEDPQLRDLLRQPVGVGGLVALGDAEEDAEAATDRAAR